MRRRWLLWGLLAVGCRTAVPELPGLCDAPLATPPLPPPLPGVTRNVIVVMLDGVRWQEVLDGVEAERAREAGLPGCTAVDARRLLPNTYARLVDRGVALGHATASGPAFISLPGYLEIFLGRASGCRSNDCAPTRRPTVADEAAGRLGTGGEVAVIASWAHIDRAAALDPERVVVSAGRHGGRSRERVVASWEARQLYRAGQGADPYPGHADYRPDRYTAPLALAYLKARRPRLLFVGLGDADEWAHRGDYGRYLGALRESDRFLGELFRELDGMGRYGAETTVIVTTDHGRDAGFNDHGDGESQRVFVLAAGGAVPPRGLVEAAGPQARLCDLAPTVRALLGLPEDRAPDAGRPLAVVCGLAARAPTGVGWR